MRIIGGTLRGRRLASLQGSAIRPTSDRIRESLFNILGPKTMGANVLDLFAGTGALGLEALSRGAQRAVFIDHATQTIQLLRKNIALCRLEAHSQIIRWDIVQNLNCLRAYPHTFDLVFMDPPYHRDLVQPALAHLLRVGALTDQACIVIEQSAKETGIPSGKELVCTDARRYGDTILFFFNVSGEHVAS